MQILSWIWILHFMNLSKSQGGAKVVRWKRSSSVSSDCRAGCATCSPLNGCLSCKPRFFFYLEVDRMRQSGTCLSSCPRGYYGTRSPQISTCTKCNAVCTSCFSENFCTRCHPGHFLFRGECKTSCPNGLTANAAQRECIECPADCEMCTRKNVCTRCRANMYHHQGQCHHTCPKGLEPYILLMECIPQIHCQVGEWTSWGPCVPKRAKLVHRRGEESRNRQVLLSPSIFGDPCSHLSEVRKCGIKKRQKYRLL